MSRKLNVAVVGVGIGAKHLEAYAELPELYAVRAICDLDADKAKAAAAQYKGSSVVTRFADLLSLPGLDVIDICTPPNTHRSLIEQALAASFHVICEKPITGSLADVDAIEKAAAKAKGTLSPIFQYRFGNRLQKLTLLQENGICGTPYLATIETSWRRDADYYAVRWRGKWDTELGGCCLSQAIGAHDILSYVNGPVKNLYARLATRVNPIEVNDCAAVSIEMANGSVATLAVTLGAAEELSRIRLIFPNLTVESRSTHPYLIGADPWYFKGKTPEIEARIASTLARFKPTHESFTGQFARIHAAISNGTPLPVTLADARASLELITAIYHSAETGTAVTLPLAAGHPKYGNWIPAGRRWNTGTGNHG
jgi:predicted dehydrogenase